MYFCINEYPLADVLELGSATISHCSVLVGSEENESSPHKCANTSTLLHSKAVPGSAPQSSHASDNRELRKERLGEIDASEFNFCAPRNPFVTPSWEEMLRCSFLHLASLAFGFPGKLATSSDGPTPDQGSKRRRRHAPSRRSRRQAAGSRGAERC